MLRDDDKEETVRRRLGQFNETTEQLINHYRQQNLVRDVSATDAPEAIYQNIVKAIRPDKLA
jgi:adenylate kinase